MQKKKPATFILFVFFLMLAFLLFLFNPLSMKKKQGEPRHDKDVSSLVATQKIGRVKDSSFSREYRRKTGETKLKIKVVSQLDNPIPNVRVYPLESGRVVFERRVLAETDSEGVASLRSEFLGRKIILLKRGYQVRRAFLRKELRGMKKITLKKGEVQDFIVKAENGQPVKGVSILLSLKAFSKSALKLSKRSSFLDVNEGEGSIRLISKKTDNNGFVRFVGLKKGTYWIKVELNGLPYILGNVAQCIVAKVPNPPILVRLKSIVAGLVQFEGGKPSFVKFPVEGGSPFLIGISKDIGNPLIWWKDYFEKKYPGCFAFTGVVKKNFLVPGQVSMSVLSANGSLLEIPVTYVVPTKDLRPQKIPLPPIKPERVAKVRLVTPKTEGFESFPPVRVVRLVKGSRFEKKINANRDIDLPYGNYLFLPSRNIVSGSFEGIQKEIKKRYVEIKVKGKALHQFTIQVLLPGGGVPNEVGISYKRIRGRRHFSLFSHLENGRGEFWSDKDTFSCWIYVLGEKRRRFEFKKGEEESWKGKQIFLAKFE